MPQGSVPNKQKTIAVFDFDNTLIKGDSLWPFLTILAGWPRAILSLFIAGIRWAHNRPLDSRSFIKEHLLLDLLNGYEIADLAPAIEWLQTWQQPIHNTLQALQDHQAQGHHIVIASGGLDLYLPFLLANIPHNALLCTRIEIREGIITGRILNGNCVRTRKAELVAEYIEKNGPYENSWGYGNHPHDLPMLRLLKNQVII